MSTKINVRSPFYLNITEPVKPTPLFTCDIANIQGLTIDQQGQISTPSLSFGVISSITSSDSDFANNKFATETTATPRTLTIRITIPAGFSNVSDGYIDCGKTVTQPALVTSGSSPSCSGGVTTNGSIPSQSLAVGGATSTINLASYFTQGSSAIAGYNIYNPDQTLVSASITGNTLTLTSNQLGGSTSINISAFDNDANTCTATQTISVSVTNPSFAFDCAAANLTGGSMLQNGTITNPNTFATITAIRTTSGDASTNITSYPANGTGSSRSVTLFFDLTIPSGYSNSGTLECSHVFTQPAANPTFDCATANLSGQQITTKGSILKGSSQLGTITSFSPIGFDTVSTDTTRSVTFNVQIPSGYANTGDGNQTIPCVRSVTQPAEVAECGSETFFISAGKRNQSDFCDFQYAITKEVTATTLSQTLAALGARVCFNGNPFEGRDRYYAVFTSKINIGSGSAPFHVWKIDDNGIIQDVSIWNCGAGVSGTGAGGAL